LALVTSPVLASRERVVLTLAAPSPVLVATSVAVIASPLASAASTAALVAPGWVRAEERAVVLALADRGLGVDERVGVAAVLAVAGVRLEPALAVREFARGRPGVCDEDLVAGVDVPLW
jgi:hypothetical protein